MLTIDPSMRPSADTCLQHPFMKSSQSLNINPSMSKPILDVRSSKEDFLNDLEQQLNKNYNAKPAMSKPDL